MRFPPTTVAVGAGTLTQRHTGLLGVNPRVESEANRLGSRREALTIGFSGRADQRVAVLATDLATLVVLSGAGGLGTDGRNADSEWEARLFRRASSHPTERRRLPK
jgi:hypothetical protein